MGPAHCPGAGQCAIAMVPRDATNRFHPRFLGDPAAPCLVPREPEYLQNRFYSPSRGSNSIHRPTVQVARRVCAPG
jgi:hypothetical protein